MKKLSLFFFRTGKLRIAILLTVIMIAYASFVMRSKSKCFEQELNEEQKLPDLRFGYSLDEVTVFFDSLSKNGQDCYEELLSVWDSLFPIFYGLMYISWLSLIYKNPGKNGNPFLLINLFPIIPVFADWTENITILRLLSEYNTAGSVSLSSAKIASFITQTKWILSFMNYMIILFGTLLLIIKKVKNKNRT